MKTTILALAAICAGSPRLSAVPITIKNPSFESPRIIDSYIIGTVADWTVAGTCGVWDPTGGPLGGLLAPPPDGLQVGFATFGGIVQTLSDSLLPFTTYTLRIDVGGRSDAARPGLNYQVSLFVGGTAVASVTPVAPPTLAWTTLSAVYTTGGSVLPGKLGILIQSRAHQLDFDNVRLDAVRAKVPEPGSTCSLAALGLLALTAFRQGRRTR